MEIDELSKIFIENAIIQGDCTNSGDYKRGNKASKVLLSIIKKISKDYNQAVLLINALKQSNEPNVIIWCTRLAFNANYEKEYFICALRKIAERKELKLISFSAQKSLEQYAKIGNGI